jgi:O-antigen/teichoic acid export membrane protein
MKEYYIQRHLYTNFHKNELLNNIRLRLTFASMIKATIEKILGDKTFTELLTGSGLVLFFKVIGMTAGYIFSLLITKLLGVESYGIFTLCFTVLSILVVISKLGLDNASVKSISKYITEGKDDFALLYFRKSIAVVTFTAFILSVGLYFCAGWLALVFDNPQIENALKVTAFIIVPNALLHMQAEKVRGLKKMGWYSFLINGSISLFASCIFILLINFYASVSVASLWALGLSIATLCIVASFRIDFKIKAPQWDSISYQNMFAVSIPMLLSGSMFLVMSWTDVLLLGYYLDETQVAVYSIAFKVSTLVAVALYAINSIASPQFSALFSNDDHIHLRKLAIQITQLNFLLTLPVIIGIVVFSKYILGFFGPEYIVGQTVLLILCAGQFFSSTCGSVLTLLNMAGKEKIVRNIVGGTALLNIVLNIGLIQLLGMEGAAIATFISLVLWNILGLIAVKKHFGFVMLPFFK